MAAGVPKPPPNEAPPPKTGGPPNVAGEPNAGGDPKARKTKAIRHLFSLKFN